MTTLETIKKLILYAEHKRRIHDPDLDLDGEAGILGHSRELRRLKRELLAAGIEPQLLELSGDEIAHLIYESIHKHK